MAAQFLEAVRNRRVNIGRSISVFGRGGKRRWHAAGNTGVMQRHTQPQKSRATHPRALRPLRHMSPFSFFTWPFSDNHNCGGAVARALVLRLCNSRYKLAEWLPRCRITVHVNKRRTDKKATVATPRALGGGPGRGGDCSSQIIGAATAVRTIWPTISL